MTVWKIYKQGVGVEIGKLQSLKDFNLDNIHVQKNLKERYGESIPLDEKIISPAEMFNSDKLITVVEN